MSADPTSERANESRRKMRLECSDFQMRKSLLFLLRPHSSRAHLPGLSSPDTRHTRRPAPTASEPGLLESSARKTHRDLLDASLALARWHLRTLKTTANRTRCGFHPPLNCLQRGNPLGNKSPRPLCTR